MFSSKDVGAQLRNQAATLSAAYSQALCLRPVHQLAQSRPQPTRAINNSCPSADGPHAWPAIGQQLLKRGGCSRKEKKRLRC